MRISKFDSNKAQDKIEALEGNIEQVKRFRTSD
jgi:topoisomerase-4 subunit A